MVFQYGVSLGGGRGEGFKGYIDYMSFPQYM